MLHSHTKLVLTLRDCQAAQAKACGSVWLPDLTTEKESKGIKHCIKAIAGEVVNRRSVLLIRYCTYTQNVVVNDKMTTDLKNSYLQERLKKWKLLELTY